MIPFMLHMRCVTIASGCAEGTPVKLFLLLVMTGQFAIGGNECARGNPARPATPSESITCTTFSGGLEFAYPSRNFTLARSLAVGACTEDNRTNNAECNANTWCSNQGEAPPLFSCRTSSHHVNYRFQGRVLDLTRDFTASACAHDAKAVRQECEANLTCQVPSQTDQVLVANPTARGMSL
jgi:hypothetical protein